MALFSGITFEDVFAGVTALPSGWSVSGLFPRPILSLQIDVAYGLYRNIMLLLVIVFLYFRCK